MRLDFSLLSLLCVSAALLLCISPGKFFAEAKETAAAEARASFSQPIEGLSTAQRQQFLHGVAIFRQRWAARAGGATAGDGADVATGAGGDPNFRGLGPTFDAPACAACHVRAGRGRPPIRQGEMLSSLIMRLSVPGAGANGAPRPHPAYGGQFNSRAIAGVPPEGQLFVEYTAQPGHYGDGAGYQLRHPVYVFYRLAFGQLGDAAMTSPRLAPALAGMGLLAAIAEADILARADADDADGDGISGRANYVWDPLSQSRRLGRFGWKANVAGLYQQAADAAFGDMGLTSALHPKHSCPPPQQACREAGGEGVELSAKRLAALTAYLQGLAPPPRQTQEDPAIERGKKLFKSTGCAVCHTPHMQTGDSEIPALAARNIALYSDLLLHDMGQALADNRPDFVATGQEWRTPPLWGLGSLMAVNGQEFLLHDGRARGIAEAILWHGGEGEMAKENFRKMPQAARRDLLAFLRSL